MPELYPSDDQLNALSGTTDSEQEVLFIPVGQSPYYTSYYKMLHRLLDVARRSGDLRVYKDGAMTFGVRAGRFMDGAAVRDFAGAAGVALADEQINYIYLSADGQLHVNQDGFPLADQTAHIPLAAITTSGGSYSHGDIVDYRGRAMYRPAGAMDSAEARMLTDGSNADSLHSHAIEIADEGITAGKLAQRSVLASKLGLRNCRFVEPGEDVASAYAWLASAERNAEFGELSSANRRTLVLCPGTHVLAATLLLDNDYVDVTALVAGSPEATILCCAGGAGAGSAVNQTACNINMSGFTIQNNGNAAGNHGLCISGRLYAQNGQTGAWINADNIILLDAYELGDSVYLSGGNPPVTAGWYHIVDEAKLDRSAGGASTNVAYQLWRGNNKSVYRNMRFIGMPTTNFQAQPVHGEMDIRGTWINCTCNDYGWRCAENRWLWADMYDCQCGSYAMGGDLPNVQIRGNYHRFTAGQSSFGGCTTAGCDVYANFYDCVMGSKCIAMGMTFGGSIYNSRLGSDCCGGFQQGPWYGRFTGYAENITASGNSFGAGHASCVNSGVMRNVTLTAMGDAMTLCGGRIYNSYLSVGGSNTHCVKLNGDGGRIIGSMLLASGSGNSVQADSSASAAIARCVMNASPAGTVTNTIASPLNVIDPNVG